VPLVDLLRFGDRRVDLIRFVAGQFSRPLCLPSLPEAKTLRPMAFSASWLRWPGERVSARTASSPGPPSTHGASSSGLHMPGAASLASTASMVAGASGSSKP